MIQSNKSILTVPLSPTLIKHSRQQNGLRIEYGKPDNGNCPNLKVYSSPGLKENSYRPSYRLFQTDEVFHFWFEIEIKFSYISFLKNKNKVVC